MPTKAHIKKEKTNSKILKLMKIELQTSSLVNLFYQWRLTSNKRLPTKAHIKKEKTNSKIKQTKNNFDALLYMFLVR